MKKVLFGFIVVLIQGAFSLTSNAGEFEWLDNLNVQATADSSGFVARLATRFHIDDVEIRAVVNQVANASDAYMVFRLGELSHRPIGEVLNVYRENKQNGWGRMAKNLGIKPGSREFHALKQGHDLDSGKDHKLDKSSKKGKNKNKGNKGNRGKN